MSGMPGVYAPAGRGRKPTPPGAARLYWSAMSGSAEAAAPGEGRESVPAGQRTQRAGHPRWYWHPYNRAGLYWLAEALGAMPRGLRLALARQLGRLAPRLLPAERAAIRMALGLITGASERGLDVLTARLFRNFAMCFSDLVSTNRRPAARLLEYVASVTGAQALHGIEGGIVSVTAHVGNWELAGRLLAHRSARRTHVVVAPEEVPTLERWVRRDGGGMRFVPRTHPRIGVELLAALRRGEVVALQGDRALGTRGDLQIPFFGRPAPFPLGPFLLARAAAVPLVPAFCVLGPGYRYAVRIAAPMEVRRGEEEEAARGWVALLEGVVREHPTQWFNFFDPWRPLGEGGPPAPGPDRDPIRAAGR
jgi:lauroyl/myristoyl acyltransferase